MLEDKDLTPAQLSCKPRVFKQAGYTIEEFDSLVQMKEWLDASPLDSKFTRNRQSSLGFSDGAPTYNEEKERLIFGNPKITGSLANTLSDSGLSFTNSLAGISMGVEGTVYDMGAVLSGVPECCIVMDNPSESKVIDIYVDIGYCGGTEVKTINYRTAAIIGLINQLMLQKVIVNFHLAHYNSVGGGYKLGTIITIKGNEGLVSQLGYLCSSSFFRELSWNLNEIRCGMNGAYGRSQPSRDIINSIEKEGGFYIAGGYNDSFWNNVKSKEEAVEYLQSKYNEWLSQQNRKELVA